MRGGGSVRFGAQIIGLGVVCAGAFAPGGAAASPDPAPASAELPAASAALPALLAIGPLLVPLGEPAPLGGAPGLWLQLTVAPDGRLLAATPDLRPDLPTGGPAPGLSPAMVLALSEALASARFSAVPGASGPVGLRVFLPLVTAGTEPVGPAAPTPSPERPPEDAGELIEVVARHDEGPSRGAYDLNIDVHDSLAVPTLNAADALTLAPGVFLVRAGSDAHPEQIFLRGFDARHGQDIAFSVDGLPLNQVGNPHGHGLVDLHSIIPEVISTMRVMEGPFDPAQGDFAVAGSARFSLGLPEPGLMLRSSAGSFGSKRAVLGWRHAEEQGTFVAGEIFQTDGYGANRDAQRGSLIARLERDVGSPTLHAMAGLYGTDYAHAGLVAREDVEADRIGFYDTQDPAQGGRGTQAFLALGVHSDDPGIRWSLDGGLAQRTLGLRDNFTGALLDERRPGETDHGQRGDLMEFAYAGRTMNVEGRAEGRREGDVVDAIVRAGAYGRTDEVESSARRLRSVDQRAYRTEADFSLEQVNVALYGEGEINVWERLSARMGLRAESFQYALLDRCAAKDGWFPGVQTDDVNCPDEDRGGVIARDQRRTARGTGLAPRGGVAFEINDSHAISAAGGRGLRSIEAAALSDGEAAGMGALTAAEGAYVWTHHGEAWNGVHRLVGFTTQVERDLVFDEERAANVVAGETRRYGALLDSELQLGPLRARSSVTWTRAVFGELPPVYTYYHSDRQEGMLIPYVPPWVAHTNLRYAWGHGRWSWGHGLGGAFVSARPLPQSEWSEPIFTVDASTEVRLGGVELAASCDNLLNRRYALAEYNFASYFPETSGADFPTRTPRRQVSPGAPRAFMFTLTIWPESL